MYVSLWNLGRVVVGAACLAGVVSVLAPAAEPAVKEAGAKEAHAKDAAAKEAAAKEAAAKEAGAKEAAAKEAAAKAEKAGPAWTSLFDGKTLGKWKPTEFGGQGEVTIKDGAIYLATGNDLTGITWSGKDWPKMNYEISLDAQRVDGTDFFCGLTFAVNQDPCSLIVGGWGGTVVGISSLDGLDAYNNNTTKIVSFKKGQWYHIRLRVTPKQLEAWIDNDKVVDADTTDKKIGIRGEVDASKPLGIATWQTTGAVKNIRFRQLPEEKAQK